MKIHLHKTEISAHYSDPEIHSHDIINVTRQKRKEPLISSFSVLDIRRHNFGRESLMENRSDCSNV